MRGHSKCIGRAVAMTSATGYDQYIKECALLGDLLSARFLMYIKRLSVHNCLKRYISFNDKKKSFQGVHIILFPTCYIPLSLFMYYYTFLRNDIFQNRRL